MIAALALTGCSKASNKDAAPQTTAASNSSTSSSTATASPSPSVTGTPSLGGRCDGLLPVSTVDEALGRPVIGKTAFVLGVAEPNIGRLTYLNCRYGLATAVKGKPAPVPAVEIGVSLYKSEAQASQRVQGTVQDYRSHGSSQQDAAVGQYSASILLGYGAPTIVVAAGPRTVAITVVANLIAAAPTSALVALAKAALDATAQYTGAPGAGASPSGSDSSDSGSPSASTTS
ncbi:MAG: hypothetical protein ACR2N4_03245 [Jatrophihabitans sp.]